MQQQQDYNTAMPGDPAAFVPGAFGAAPRSSAAEPTALSGAAEAARPWIAGAVARRSGKKVNQKELANLTSQLAIMTRSGLDLASALHSVSRRCRHPALRAVLTEVHSDVMGGKSLSAALSAHAHVFGMAYVASIAAGEASGRIPEVLAQLAQLLRNEVRLQSVLRTLLAYPVVLSSVSLLVLTGLVLLVLPQFAAIFEQFEAPLPAITQVLISISAELRARFWLWGPLAIGLVAGAVVFRYSAKGKRCFDRLALQLMFVRDVTQSICFGRACRLMGLMLESGVPLLECLKLARSASGNSLYVELFATLEDDVSNGRGMSSALLTSEFVPAAAAEMVVTAERSGNLGPVTQLVGEHYLEEGESRLREIVAVLEPAITVVMGGVVAFVVLAVMLPMFDLATLANH